MQVRAGRGRGLEKKIIPSRGKQWDSRPDPQEFLTEEQTRDIFSSVESIKKDNLPDDFLSIPEKEISNIPFKNQIIRARLLNIVDGDTISVAIFCGHPLKIKIRLADIDTPELHPKQEDTVGEALAAQKVKKYVDNLFILHSLVSIKLMKLDKYGGRYVGHIFLESGESLSDHLLSRGYAKKYDGRAKPPWKKEDFNAINSS